MKKTKKQLEQEQERAREIETARKWVRIMNRFHSKLVVHMKQDQELQSLLRNMATSSTI